MRYHYKNPTKRVGQYKADLIIISLTINLFSPWYNWTNAVLAFKQQSLTNYVEFHFWLPFDIVKLFFCITVLISLSTMSKTF